MLPCETLEHVVWVRVVFPELLYNILADVAVVLLDFVRNTKLIFRGDGRSFTPFTQEIKHEL